MSPIAARNLDRGESFSTRHSEIKELVYRYNKLPYEFKTPEIDFLLYKNQIYKNKSYEENESKIRDILSRYEACRREEEMRLLALKEQGERIERAAWENFKTFMIYSLLCGILVAGGISGYLALYP